VTQELWTSVDNYIVDVLHLADDVLTAAVTSSEEAGLPSIQVSPPQGKLIHLLARSLGARRILEIGTLGGYSTIWLARALPPDGELITIEIDAKHARVARSNIERAKLSDKVSIINGDARAVLEDLEHQPAAPFDLTFIDADKPNIPLYFESALRMSHAGSVIIIDNVVREGKVVEPEIDDASVQGVRKLKEMMSSNPRVSSTIIQTVGVKGYDGLAIALVN
jgi:predicted O-methyltransferase YrrM